MCPAYMLQKVQR